MNDQRIQDLGPEHRRHCADHQNCIYRIEMLEESRKAIEKNIDIFRKEIYGKIDNFQKLLIANLAGICVSLMLALIGLGIYIAKTL